MGGFLFLSYSNADGKERARKLADRLLKIPPSIPVWLDERELQAGTDWDEQIVDALRECAGLLFLMTPDSVHRKSECKREWTRALRYKKPIIPLLFHPDAEMPYRLEPRQSIDFTQDVDQALAALRANIRRRSTPEGRLHELRERLSDAERDLPRARDDRERSRIEAEIESIKKDIASRQQAISDPEGTRRKASARIESALERERRPAKPVHTKARTKFINPPPSRAPVWFQNRCVETRWVGDFLQDEGLRLMTVVGRGGVGKTAMVCRLLKALESGHLPDDLGPLSVDGIVYLSPKGVRQVNLPHLFADLCKLLPAETAKSLGEIYRGPQTPTQAKMQALLNAFPRGRTILLLDNFEELVDQKSAALRDQELEEALRALLELPHHGIKVIITTRLAPRNLLLTQPGRQTKLDLDEGLESPHAENLLREMDASGNLGLKDAPSELLDEARQRTLGYPRALEALAAILAADRGSSLKELLADTEQLLPENVVEALVGEAFSSLDPMSQQVMQALAVLGAAVSAGAVDYVLQPYAPGIDSAPILRRLVNMLFARRESGHFHLHQVDRSYAMQRIPEGQPTDREATPLPFSRFALLHRAAEFYKTTRTPSTSWRNIDDLAPQLSEIHARIAGGEYEEAASVLLEIDFNYLLVWGHARLVAELHESLLGRLTDHKLPQASLGKLGVCYYNLGDYPRAIEYLQQALAIARDIGDQSSEEASLGNLGNCYDSLGDYPRAIECHEQSLAIARETSSRSGEGASLGNLGLCYFSLGDYPRAIDYHNQALAIAHEISDRSGEGNSLGNLGLCYEQLGNYPRAISFHEQFLAITREIGDRSGESISLGNLGNCYSSLGDDLRTIDFHEQSLAIAREIGDRSGEGVSLGNLALSYDKLGEYLRATAIYEQSLTIAREIGDRYLESNVLTNLGGVHAITREFGQAHECYRGAIRLADRTGNRQNQHEARFGLAVAYLLQDDLVAAQNAIETTHQYSYIRNDAAAWTVAGIVRLRQNEPVSSREAFSQGLAAADGLLEMSTQNLSALETKALALCGLALTEDKHHLTEAKRAFRAAREISTAKGVVARLLDTLDALAVADTDDILAMARKAAAGEE